jgi:RNA-directed DNA polymerase
MSERRQKIQLELAFTSGSRSEAPMADGEGTESLATKSETESPAAEQLMEEVLKRENLLKALKRVKANRGDAGIDRMTVEELPAYLAQHWLAIREQLLAGTYKPQAVKRVEIPKPGGGMRRLGIPTVLDRFIQQAVLQVLQSKWDQSFSEHSYGFRPKRSAQQAVKKARKYIAEGNRFVVDIDLEKFFDQVNHDKLMGLVGRRVRDKRMLKLIRAFLNAGVMENGLVGPTDEGTPQGGPLSPLLSNLMLDELDRELERRGHKFCRYADDCNIYVRSERAGRRVMESISKYITKRLRLKVNQQKSAVARAWERKFLGFSFSWDKEPKLRIAPQAIKRMKEQVRELTIGRGASIEHIVEELSEYLKGWIGYFGICETPSVLKRLDQWVRRRLRSLMWRQWKRGRTRYGELRRRAVGKDLAAQTAGSAHGPWHLSRSPALNYALPDAYFRKLGLPTLAAQRVA